MLTLHPLGSLGARACPCNLWSPPIPLQGPPDLGEGFCSRFVIQLQIKVPCGFELGFTLTIEMQNILCYSKFSTCQSLRESAEHVSIGLLSTHPLVEAQVIVVSGDDLKLFQSVCIRLSYNKGFRWVSLLHYLFQS